MASIIVAVTANEYMFHLSAARSTMKNGNALSLPSEISDTIKLALWKSDTMPDDFFATRCKIRLAKNGNTVTGGYIVLDGVLMGLFANGCPGSWLLGQAHKDGASKLDCFDGFLVSFYGKHGWKETSRAANWTAGQPDVVWMARN